MTYYAFIENDKINGTGECKCLNEDIYNVEIAEEIYNDIERYMAVKRDVEVEVPDFEIVDIEVQIHDVDEDGNYIYDENENPITHTETRPVQEQVGSHTEIQTIYEIVLNPNYEQEEQEKERQRLNLLSLTKREVFLALYRAKGITPDMVRGSITDEEALIEFDYAERFYRGNPLIDSIGIMLGYSVEDLDYLFTHKELPKSVNSEESE